MKKQTKRSASSSRPSVSSHSSPGKRQRSHARYAGTQPPKPQRWPVPDMSPPKIPTGAQVQTLSTGDLAEHLRFVVRQCAQKGADWLGWPASRTWPPMRTGPST